MKFFLRVWTILLPLLLMTAAPTEAQVINDMDLHLKVSLLEEPQPPEIVDGRVLLTYRSNTFNRYVAAAFAHENYRRIHEFQRVDRTGTDMFFLLVPIPQGINALEYRLVVDGLWQRDPVNPRSRVDGAGRRVSVFPIPEEPASQPEPPIVRDGGEVRFVFDREAATRQMLRTADGQLVGFAELADGAVYLAGSFNNYDPFMYRLRPQERGGSRLSLSLTLPPGTHYYYFVISGEKVLDPLNPDRSTREGGRQVNRFVVR